MAASQSRHASPKQSRVINVRDALEQQSAVPHLQHYNNTEIKSKPSRDSLLTKVSTWWGEHVVLTVSHDQTRDHHALERTFLAYLRTSLSFAVLAIVITQLFRLSQTLAPSATHRPFGYFVLAVPVGNLFLASAIVIALTGAIRFWRQQSAISRGQVHVGGWELFLIPTVSLLMMLLIFGLFLGAEIEPQVTIPNG